MSRRKTKPKRPATTMIATAATTTMLQPALLRRSADAAILQVAPGPKGLGPKVRNITPDPLDWYFHRRQISGTQHRAGNHVRVLHYAAHGSGIAAVNYRGFHGIRTSSDNWRFSSRQAHALRELSQLLQQLPAAERTMLEHVVVWGEFANHVAERRLDLRPRIGIALLRRALTAIDALRSASGR